MLRRRALRRCGGRLGLIALFTQLFLSYAHIHPADIYGPSGRPLAAPAALVQPLLAAPAPPAGPHHPGAPDGAVDSCPICAAMAMAAATILPDPPPLVLPDDRAAALPVVPADPPARPTRLLLFRTRAPPLA